MAYDVQSDLADLDRYLKGFIRDIPDFPKPGIVFRDITTLLLSPEAMRTTVQAMAEPYRAAKIDRVVGIEARGFILGGALACALDAGFAPIRKSGKLPGETYRQDYALEYGADAMEIHRDALGAANRVLLVDDLIATGGTAAAALDLIRLTGATIAGAAFIVDLPDLGGRRQIEKSGISPTTLCAYRGI